MGSLAGRPNLIDRNARVPANGDTIGCGTVPRGETITLPASAGGSPDSSSGYAEVHAYPDELVLRG